LSPTRHIFIFTVSRYTSCIERPSGCLWGTVWINVWPWNSGWNPCWFKGDQERLKCVDVHSHVFNESPVVSCLVQMCPWTTLLWMARNVLACKISPQGLNGPTFTKICQGHNVGSGIVLFIVSSMTVQMKIGKSCVEVVVCVLPICSHVSLLSHSVTPQLAHT